MWVFAQRIFTSELLNKKKIKLNIFMNELNGITQNSISNKTPTTQSCTYFGAMKAIVKFKNS
jgi:hypothetical protein